MKLKRSYNLPLDKFINLSLYNKKFGYYMKNNPFGKQGDFTTAPNISRLFSEMIAVWILSFWQSLGSPKKFNLIELGAGNGEMMKVLIESFKNFPDFLKSCSIVIIEKSPVLTKIQKKKLHDNKIIWLTEFTKLKKKPCIFMANEFFDSMAIKQFLKIKNSWFERFVSFKNGKEASFFNKEVDMRKFEKKIDYRISKNQNFIEYSQQGIKYLKEIIQKIQKNTGGILLIDYGYSEKKMKNTLQAISNHKFSNILENIGNSDITHNINFNLFKQIVKQSDGLKDNLINQKKFLINMGIKQRAEIISKNQSFLKKADIYYRLKRLIDDKQMGDLFKVMLIKNRNNEFKLGF
jgi:NADH dehydrogenase [ubiquinone] 1 alpha subcomplex assembly factor 7